ncbi:CHRD domain-containing protein [Tessaracoccus sp. OS52]|uniref:CHRD domain-containing protein n=1 Tax=Tessaracoccus sp. OS52 TaxID=2886691 RepID=UPI001D11F112|nr:CHRD domain-containing protein [Tessaracoccus sp. OS52]MCC2594675.1 CHRD domain-containing protein [Tessaracoccus sp. OS52]
MRRTVLVSAFALALAAVPVMAAGDAPPVTGGRPLAVELTGAAERPGPGDPDGVGTAYFTLNPGLGEICYALEVSGISPARAAHIHVAGPDAPGPVVVPLVAPTDGSSSGCADVDRELVMEILRHPGEYYVNVHNADYPGGALRGQLG